MSLYLSYEIDYLFVTPFVNIFTKKFLLKSEKLTDG